MVASPPAMGTTGGGTPDRLSLPHQQASALCPGLPYLQELGADQSVAICIHGQRAKGQPM